MTPSPFDPFALARDLGGDVLGVAHSLRFRKVANAYPRAVASAYGGDLALAASHSDERVAATVWAWEEAQGLTPRDWRAVGASERDEDGAAGEKGGDE